MNRVRAWWNIGERACRTLTEPRVDADAVDRAALAVLRESWLGSTCLTIVSRVHAAWIDSRCRRLVRSANGQS